MPDALRHKAELALVESADRLAVLDLDAPGEPPVVLAGAARAVWAAVDGERALAEVVTVVAASYGVEEAVVETDVRAFVADLLDRGLLVMSPGVGPDVSPGVSPGVGPDISPVGPGSDAEPPAGPRA